MLTAYGVQTTNNKKDWITQALQIVPSLEPDDNRHPWKFLKAVHQHIAPELHPNDK